MRSLVIQSLHLVCPCICRHLALDTMRCVGLSCFQALFCSARLVVLPVKGILAPYPLPSRLRSPSSSTSSVTAIFRRTFYRTAARSPRPGYGGLSLNGWAPWLASPQATTRSPTDKRKGPIRTWGGSFGPTAITVCTTGPSSYRGASTPRTPSGTHPPASPLSSVF